MTCAAASKPNAIALENMQKEIQGLATSFINEETKRRPFIFVSISKV